MVLLVVGWWVQKSRRAFCEYTLRLFGNRLKGWREGRAVYRSALPSQGCASRSVASVARFKAWSRTACLQMINKRQNHLHDRKNGVKPLARGVCPPMSCDSATELSLSAEGFLPRNPQPSSANRPKLWVELVSRLLP